MIKNTYETLYNKIIYTDYKYEYEKYENIILIELYRIKLYNKFKLYLHKVYKKITDKYKNNIDIKNKDIFPSIALLLDILSILLLNQSNKKDPIFNDISPYTKDNLNYYFKNKCISSITDDLIYWFIKILSKMSKKYIKYYNKLYNKINNKIKHKYNINYIIENNNIIIQLNIIKKNNIIKKIENPIIISSNTFNYLVKLYNNKNYNDYTNINIIDDKVLEYIYMIFLRYTAISSGNNQSSILISFKQLLKDKLNIRIELFASVINTSSTTFGSIFYDIEKVFGSIGNYFNTDIIKGYYEINPIFDRCLINNIIIKCTNELEEATRNENGLLFLFIIPASYFKFDNEMYRIKKFKAYSKILDKEYFPYIRYNRNYNKIIISSIVKTNIIICHNNFIEDNIKQIVINFNIYINEWINKNKNNKTN
jgi:hypothetical protein